MRTERRVGLASGAVCLAAALLPGCADRAAASVPAVAQAAPAPPSQSQAGRGVDPAAHFSADRCMQFDQHFDEFAACQRADGTLESFSARDISWRVRYFVRYWQMPCNEAPTVEEGYVYHMVTDDLYGDKDVDSKQRMAIRTAMFDGKVNCK